ncbi:MAG: hypothetical protein FJW38_09615, partial [Acidobacteria bacterium]|nr:hypothetical protein [Acidobacteriota bacterium]
MPFFLRFPCSPPLVALAAAFLAFFRQRAALQLEILALRHQLGVLQRSVKPPKLTAADRFLWASGCRRLGRIGNRAPSQDETAVAADA